MIGGAVACVRGEHALIERGGAAVTENGRVGPRAKRPADADQEGTGFGGQSDRTPIAEPALRRGVIRSSLRWPSGRLLRRMVALACLITTWQLLVVTGVLNPLFVASPGAVITEFRTLWSSGVYQEDLGTSLRRVVVGFIVGGGAAVICGYVLASSPLAEDIFDWPVQAARSISPLALVPLTVLWLGTGELQKYVLIGITVFFPVLIAVHGAVRSVPEEILRGARTLNCQGRWRTFRYVVIPISAPAIFNALRIGIAMALLVIVAAEMIGADNGIGYLILNSGQVFDTPAVFVGIVSVAVLGTLFDRILLLAKRRFCRWHVETVVG